MEAEYRMYDHDRVENGEDAFPDACEGCPHYGGGCPIITWRSPQEELDRIAESATDGTTFKRNSRARHPARLSPHSDVDHAVGDAV